MQRKDADFQTVGDYLNNFIESSNHAPNDIYNVDETGLYFRAFPHSYFRF